MRAEILILVVHSDGKTPDEQVAQILALAPILPASQAGGQQQQKTQPSLAESSTGTQPQQQTIKMSREEALMRQDSSTGGVDTFVDAES